MSTQPNVVKKIDNQLIMRRSTRADAQRLAEFYSGIFKREDGSPDESFYPYIEDLLNGRHPTFHEDDYLYIEEADTGRIVSGVNLISQTWTFGGIAIPVGRPESVATLPEYRNRGLVRALFQEIHAWSHERGELMQGITGIPYYYRIFGYEMCVELEGGWRGTPDTLSQPTEAQKEAYHIRPAAETDIPFLAELYQQSCSRLLLACPRPPQTWYNSLFVRSQKTGDSFSAWVVETGRHEPLGFYLHPVFLGADFIDKNGLVSNWYALKKGVSYLDVTPVVLQHMLAAGNELGKSEGRACSSVGFLLDNAHPVFQVVEQSLPIQIPGYTWYIRVPDVAAFLMKIAPVLEKRLDDSWCSGYTGQLLIGFYRDRVKLSFKQGRLESAEAVKTVGDSDCDALFPNHTFLHLLFGYRSLAEIRHIYCDVMVSSKVRPLIKALFPTIPSSIWPF